VNKIAGHIFEPPDSPEARCIECGRWWADVEHVTRDDIGKNGIAQIGTMNTTEYDQIDAERTRRAELKERAWAATVGVSSR
jgi:hypothetical protein